jgi:hypothetical protein
MSNLSRAAFLEQLQLQRMFVRCRVFERAWLGDPNCIIWLVTLAESKDSEFSPVLISVKFIESTDEKGIPHFTLDIQYGGNHADTWENGFEQVWSEWSAYQLLSSDAPQTATVFYPVPGGKWAGESTPLASPRLLRSWGSLRALFEHHLSHEQEEVLRKVQMVLMERLEGLQRELNSDWKKLLVRLQKMI